MTSLADIQGFLLDLDGTLYLGSKTFPWTAGFLKVLRNQGKRHLFLTNNSSKSTSDYAKSLVSRGIQAGTANILSSGWSAIRYLRKETDIRSLFVLGTPSLETELREAGFDLDSASPEAVLIGFDLTLTYTKLERAAHLLRAGLPYYATHADLVCPSERGPIPDTGSMIALLEAATGRRPVVLGKPYRPMIEAALERLGTMAEQTAMVGDRLYTDMKMARDYGLVSILVLSGETTRQDYDNSTTQVDFVFENVGEIAEKLADINLDKST